MLELVFDFMDEINRMVWISRCVSPLLRWWLSGCYHYAWHYYEHLCTALYVHTCSLLALAVVVSFNCQLDRILNHWRRESQGKTVCIRLACEACLWESILIMVTEVGRSAYHEWHHSLVRETVKEWRRWALAMPEPLVSALGDILWLLLNSWCFRDEL